MSKKYKLLKDISSPSHTGKAGDLGVLTDDKVWFNNDWKYYSIYFIKEYPDWFEEVKEETPTEQKKPFAWTDDLVAKYAATYIGDTIQDMNYFKQQHR